MKMRTKIMLSFFLCLAAAMAALLWTAGAKTGELGAQITDAMGIRLAQSRAGEVGAWFAERKGELRIIGEFYALQERSEEESLRYLGAINARMEEYYGSDQYAVFRVNATGFGWMDAQTAVDVFDQPYFQQALASGAKTLISTPTAALQGETGAIAVLNALDSEDNGYLVAFIPSERIENLLTELDTMGFVAWIMDPSGALVAEDQNHAHGVGACPREYSLRALSASSALRPTSGITGLKAPNGQRGRLFFSEIPETSGWRLAMWMPEETLFDPVWSMIRTVVLFGLGVFALGALLCLKLSGSLTKPIRRLRRSMDAVEQGVPGAKVEIHGADEIAALGKSYNDMIDRVKKLLEQVESGQKEKNAMQLKLLQAQINPHFIYNTLDMLRYKALEYQADEVAGITSALSSFFRISLSRGREFITLNEEAEHAYLYLYLQQMRYPGKLDYDIDLEEGLEEVPVPKLVLQPLVENALMHGLKPALYRGRITVKIRAAGPERIELRVEDDGAGMDPETLQKVQQALSSGSQGSGFGLYNVHQRLILAYGKESGLHLQSAVGEGTAVWFFVPRKKGEEHEGEPADR